ncbi:MAG: hypothetical protein WB586_03895 [Chthoniobacterales bacterium]
MFQNRITEGTVEVHSSTQMASRFRFPEELRKEPCSLLFDATVPINTGGESLQYYYRITIATVCADKHADTELF